MFFPLKFFVQVIIMNNMLAKSINFLDKITTQYS